MNMTITEPKDDSVAAPLLGPHDPAPFSLVNEAGKARCLIVADHAGRAVPEKLAGLGLSDDVLATHHDVHDLGTRRLTEALAARLDAPAILANYTRLVVDPNRRPDHPTSIVAAIEGCAVPGNAALRAEDRRLRLQEIFVPYHDKITALIDDFIARDIVPVILSIHSFTKHFYSQIRPWPLGLLWVQDRRIIDPLRAEFLVRGFDVGDNEPYDARILRGTTVNHHADGRRLPNALIEMRNDQLDSDGKIEEWADIIADSLQKILADESIYSYYEGPDHDHDPACEQDYIEKLRALAQNSQKEL